MIYLLVGKTGAFETLLVAGILLGMERKMEDSPLFGDLEAERQGQPIFIGATEVGNQVYSIGASNPEIIKTISHEIARVAGQGFIPLEVVPVSISGDDLTRFYIQLSRIPWIGSWFGQLAKSRVKRRKEVIIQKGRRILDQLSIKQYLVAAKPLKPS